MTMTTPPAFAQTPPCACWPPWPCSWAGSALLGSTATPARPGRHRPQRRDHRHPPGRAPGPQFAAFDAAPPPATTYPATSCSPSPTSKSHWQARTARATATWANKSAYGLDGPDRPAHRRQPRPRRRPARPAARHAANRRRGQHPGAAALLHGLATANGNRPGERQRATSPPGTPSSPNTAASPTPPSPGATPPASSPSSMTGVSAASAPAAALACAAHPELAVPADPLTGRAQLGRLSARALGACLFGQLSGRRAMAPAHQPHRHPRHRRHLPVGD